jgi:hypothetical protein
MFIFSARGESPPRQPYTFGQDIFYFHHQFDMRLSHDSLLAYVHVVLMSYISIVLPDVTATVELSIAVILCDSFCSGIQSKIFYYDHPLYNNNNNNNIYCYNISDDQVDIKTLHDHYTFTYTYS